MCVRIATSDASNRLACVVFVAGLGLLAGCNSQNDASTDRVALATWSISDSPSVPIGGVDPGPEYVIHRLVGATRLSDGRLVVADTSMQVR